MRLSPFFPIEWQFPIAGEKEEEAKKILALLRKDDTIILLDERGKLVSTPDIAKILEEGKNNGVKRLVLIIGGAYGVDNTVKERAHKTISLSALVFPHMLVRVILIEQLYRANSTLHGGKYHHE